MTKETKARTTLGRVKSVNSEAHTVDFVINSGGGDLMHEELNPMGCDYADFMRNAVVLWAHDDWSPPIAKALDVRLDPDEGVLSTAKFAVDLDPFAARIFKLYEHEYLHGASVRFLPTETINYDEDSPERQERGVRRRYEQWKLLEYSAVPIPCDPNALARGLETMREVRGAGALKRLTRQRFLGTDDDAVALATLMMKMLEDSGDLETVLAGTEHPLEPVTKAAELPPVVSESSALLDPEMDAALAGVLKIAREHLWALNR
jgi:hypothetical protein